MTTGRGKRKARPYPRPEVRWTDRARVLAWSLTWLLIGVALLVLFDMANAAGWHALVAFVGRCGSAAATLLGLVFLLMLLLSLGWALREWEQMADRWWRARVARWRQDRARRRFSAEALRDADGRLVERRLREAYELEVMPESRARMWAQIEAELAAQQHRRDDRSRDDRRDGAL